MINDSATLAVPALATRYEALICACREIGKRREPKELFTTLAEELHGAVRFDFREFLFVAKKPISFRIISSIRQLGPTLLLRKS